MNNEYLNMIANNIKDASLFIVYDLRLLEETIEPQDKAAIRDRIMKNLKYVEQGTVEVGSIVARHN